MPRGDDNKLPRSNRRLIALLNLEGTATSINPVPPREGGGWSHNNQIKVVGPEHLKAAMDNGGHFQQETKQCNNQIKRKKNGNEKQGNERDSKGEGKSEGNNS